MAKKIKEIQNGDVKSNIVTLRSVWGKVGQKYFIEPQRNPRTGRFPECVKRVNSQGDIILTPEELDKESKGLAAYIKEDKVFIIQDGTTFNLDDVYEAAEWEAIKYCDLIAPDRFAKNENGDYLIDGTIDPRSPRPRYGAAELYVERPGVDSQRRVTHKKLCLQAANFIGNDERGYDGRLLVAKVLGRNMSNQPNSDVEDYLLSVADKTPEKIIDCYTGGDMNLRMLFIEAKEKHSIVKRNGLYMYGDDVILGANDTAVINWMKEPKNSKILAMLRKDTFPEMYGEDDK